MVALAGVQSKPLRIQVNLRIRSSKDHRISRVVKFFLTLVISGLCLYFAARNIEWQKIWQDIRTMRPVYASLAGVLLFLGISLRALRWHEIIRRKHAFGFSNTFWATCIGYLGNNILPARAGEIIRSVILALSANIRTSLVLATALTERIIDAGVLLLLALGMLSFTAELPAAIKGSWSILLPAVLAVLTLVLLAPLMQNFWLGILARLPLPHSLRERLRNLFTGLMDGVRAFYSLRLMLGFFVLTIVIWIIDATGVMVLAYSFGSELTIPQAVIFIAALGFASSVPSTPGYVGVFQAIAVILLPVFGVTANRAFLLVSFFQLLLLIITLISGGAGWIIMQRRIGAQRLEAGLEAAE